MQREKEVTIVRSKLGCRIGVRVGGLLVSIFAIAPGHAQHAPSNASPIEQDSAFRQVVLGIISFTHWPTPPDPVRLCIVGDTRFVPDGENAPFSSSVPAVVTRKASANDPAVGSTCDALYMGKLSGAEQRKLSISRAGHPVLTFSEDDASCTLGAMFCLKMDNDRVAFDMNLDSVARSGVRVSPKVLELARKRSTP